MCISDHDLNVESMGDLLTCSFLFNKCRAFLLRFQRRYWEIFPSLIAAFQIKWLCAPAMGEKERHQI